MISEPPPQQAAFFFRIFRPKRLRFREPGVIRPSKNASCCYRKRIRDSVSRLGNRFFLQNKQMIFEPPPSQPAFFRGFSAGNGCVFASLRRSDRQKTLPAATGNENAMPPQGWGIVFPSKTNDFRATALATGGFFFVFRPKRRVFASPG